ncbi:hypothetical protein [Synechococcus sp. MU1650]|uniref:hypothetical protein n=1 Tax=Synechococcus sp. MU1650 TaxID=2508352 RepID=UPI001CF90FE5|nr:hypothetical protein [Synechococcus sp. MU1650]
MELQLGQARRAYIPAQGIHTFFLQNKDFDGKTLPCNCDTLPVAAPSKAQRSLQAASQIHKELPATLSKKMLYAFRNTPVFGLVLHKTGRAHNISTADQNRLLHMLVETERWIVRQDLLIGRRKLRALQEY